MQGDIKPQPTYPDTLSLGSQTAVPIIDSVAPAPTQSAPTAVLDSKAAVDPRGYKTSEFWLTIAAVVLTDAQPYVQNWGTAAKLVSLGLGVLAALGYVASRTAIKMAK